jgi:hypothetical protein
VCPYMLFSQLSTKVMATARYPVLIIIIKKKNKKKTGRKSGSEPARETHQ